MGVSILRENNHGRGKRKEKMWESGSEKKGGLLGRERKKKKD